MWLRYSRERALSSLPALRVQSSALHVALASSSRVRRHGGGARIVIASPGAASGTREKIRNNMGKDVMRERRKGVHCVDLGESFLNLLLK